jgi:hypothetical protein
VTREQLLESALDPSLADTQVFYEGEGCIECGGTGFKGPNRHLRAHGPLGSSFAT